MSIKAKLAFLTVGILLVLQGDKMSKPRGIRNNNAGNIRGSSAFTWLGETGRDDKGFVIFDTPENGIRALYRTLMTYRSKYGVVTVNGIINRWAPSHENNTQAYVNHASAALGVSQDAPLSIAQTRALVPVIIKHENGVQPYSQGVINAGIQSA